MSLEEYDDLMWSAQEAADQGDMWTSGLLFERAYQLALDLGARPEAFEAVRMAAHSWSYSADPDRGIRLLLEAQQHPEASKDVEGQYWLHLTFLIHAIDGEMAIGDLDRQMARLSELAVRGWGAEGSMTHAMRGALFTRRGEWGNAIEAAERAWAALDTSGPQDWPADIAWVACHNSLQLGRRAEAERWKHLVLTTEEAPTTFQDLAKCQSNLGQFDNDALAARSASRQLDALANPENPVDVLSAVEEAIYALVLDASEGDPASPDHLIRLRLNHRPVSGPVRFSFRYYWYRVLACLELAGVRYAAGMQPVDDYFYAVPQTLPDPEEARLPTEVLPRLAAFHRACDTALEHALEADTRFDCTWRQEDIAGLRQRGEAIAAVFRTP